MRCRPTAGSKVRGRVMFFGIYGLNAAAFTPQNFSLDITHKYAFDPYCIEPISAITDFSYDIEGVIDELDFLARASFWSLSRQLSAKRLLVQKNKFDFSGRQRV